MSLLEGAQFQGGLQALYGNISFSPDANTSPRLGADGGGNAVGWLPGGNMSVVVPLGERWRVGLSALSYFGLAEDYGDDWVGRYYVQQSALLGMSVLPSVSVQATEWLSLGAGMNAMCGFLGTDVAVNNSPIDLRDTPDGRMELKDQAWGFGANAGVLIKAGEKTRVGVSYLSPVELDFADTPSFTGLGPILERVLADPGRLDLGVTVPQSVMVSAYHALDERWALMGNVGWQNWEQFGQVQAGVESGGATTLELEYKDTWHGALGAQFKPSDKWLLSAGAAYDSAAVDDENRTVTLPMGAAWRFGFGAQYQISKSLNLGLAQTFMWLGDLGVDQGSDLSLRGRVSGSYDDSWFSITSLNLTWVF